MKLEKPEKKARGRADYAFSIAPHYQRVRFFAEAKRPQPNVDTADNCFQAIRYSWPKGLPIAVLTDFNHIHIIDSRFRPNIDTAKNRIVRTWHCSEFQDKDKFSELYWLLSREAVVSGSIEIFAEIHLPAPQAATRQYSLFANEAREFDDDFLNKMDEWRESLATSFKLAQLNLSGEQLTECVQRTLDRLIFVRFAEDKNIEPDQVIAKFGLNNKTHWRDFINTCKRLDQTYNGIVFKPHNVLDNQNFEPYGATFADICDELTDEHSPYNFDSIPVEILGRIYERFLGKVVQAKKKSVQIVEKDDVRKAGGVFYTPDYIVAYMVEQSLGHQVNNKKPDDILKLSIIDTACGSGSFLIGTFAYLLQSIVTYYRTHPKEASATKKGLLEERDGELHLSLVYKRQILLNCIYGVDIDTQAVEVAQLSLYLKLMEEETTHTTRQQQLEIGLALLPSLTDNIVVENSLVTIEDDLFAIDKLRATKSLDFKSAFSKVFKTGGFDLLIGNPPYIKEYTNKDAFKHVKLSPYYQGKMDLWYLFACRGLDLLKPETGILAYIATNNWVTNSGAKKMRVKITKDALIEKLIDFGDFKVFRDAGVQTMILIAKRSSGPVQYTFDYRKLEGSKRPLSDAKALLEKIDLKDSVYLTPTLDRDRKSTEAFTFSDSATEILLNKLASKANFYLTDDEVAQGIVAPQDFLNKKGKESLGKNFIVGQGIFNLSTNEKNGLGLSKIEGSLIKPFYTSNELGRYYGSKKNKLWVIYTPSKFKDAVAIAQYPNIKKHLDKFTDIITSDNHPYGLHRSRDERFFVGEKIVSLRKCSEPVFTYSDFPCYVSQTFNVIKTDRANHLFLTGLLNSRLVKFWLKHKGKMQGKNFQVDKEPILSIPLRLPTKAEQNRLAKIVKKIIDCLKEVESAKTDNELQQLKRYAIQYETQFQTEVEVIYELTDIESAML